MNTSKIGSILATTLVWLVVGTDPWGKIIDVEPGKYISKKHCHKVSRGFNAVVKIHEEAYRKIAKEDGEKYVKTTYTCLPVKWDGKASEGGTD